MEYTYNKYRQLELQRATNIPAGVDDHVQSIKFLYHSVYHKLQYATSYENNDATGTVRNALKNTYYWYGGMLGYSNQSHDDSNVDNAPEFRYYYGSGTDDDDVFNNGLRRTVTYYPGPMIIRYSYGATDSIDDCITRGYWESSRVRLLSGRVEMF